VVLKLKLAGVSLEYSSEPKPNVINNSDALLLFVSLSEHTSTDSMKRKTMILISLNESVSARNYVKYGFDKGNQ
jgi:hypothetical protein